MEKILKTISNYLLEIVIMIVICSTSISSLIAITYCQYLEHIEKMEYIEKGYIQKRVGNDLVWVKE